MRTRPELDRAATEGRRLLRAVLPTVGSQALREKIEKHLKDPHNKRAKRERFWVKP